MDVLITRTIPVYRTPEDHGVFIQWTVTTAPSADIIFTLERAGSPTGPFDVILTNLTGYYFFDKFRTVPEPPLGATRENLNFLSLVRTIYYKITATASTGAVAFSINGVKTALPPRQERLERKIKRDLAVGFKFNGTSAYILKRKHWGVRCRKCFDVLTKKVTNSKCPVCFGTGFEGGYETPVLITGRFTAPNSNTDMTPQGLSDTTKMRFICADYPDIDPLDVIVDKYRNHRFIVQQQSETELRRNTIHQSMVISFLSTDSAEYQIPVNTDMVPVIY